MGGRKAKTRQEREPQPSGKPSPREELAISWPDGKRNGQAAWKRQPKSEVLNNDRVSPRFTVRNYFKDIFKKVPKCSPPPWRP